MPARSGLLGVLARDAVGYSDSNGSGGVDVEADVEGVGPRRVGLHGDGAGAVGGRGSCTGLIVVVGWRVFATSGEGGQRKGEEKGKS